MAGRVEFGIEGAREMERLLEQLGPAVASRVADRALLAAAKPIIAEAKRLVHKRTGALERSIVAIADRRGALSERTARRAAAAAAKADSERIILIGFKPPTSRRAHLEEFGSSRQPAHPFMRPALDSQAAAALAEMGRVMAAGITREAVKLAKKR